MKTADDFFSDLKDWSERKLNIIKKYVDGFSRILGSRNDELYYVDGFAGKGIYGRGEKGSPVLIAEFSQGLRSSNAPYILYCLNVEKDPDVFSNLCDATSRFGRFIENLEGSFDGRVDDILIKIKGNPSIFFIDPFGVKGADWNSVEKILSRKETTDIWIRFDHKTVLRLCGSFDSDARAARGKLGALQKLFGISDLDYLWSRLGCGETPKERIDNAVRLYVEQLENGYSRAGKQGFAAAYPIISLDGQQKYHLVFACAHPKAATLASDIVNGIEETLQREIEEYQENQSGQMSLFSSAITAEQVFDEKVRILKKLILLLPKHNPKSRANLHYELLVYNKKWFGKIRGKHITRALKELVDEKKITCNGAISNNESVITILE
jgi:three-Cys-motif partner protein